jgi:predicted enzyme related to lactoylglutathione lyase
MMVSTVPSDEAGRPIRPGVNGMILKRKHPEHPFANYISVESVDEYGAKAEALGGHVIMPKTPVPGMGWFLYFKDTEGNILGLWQSDPAAA